MGIYERLGVRPAINARGTFSYMGGSLPLPEVTEAMAEAGSRFVNTYELEAAVGKRLAELTNNEAAFVSSCAAAGLLLAACAVMAGTDPAKRDQLPDTTGMKDECIAQAANKVVYSQCVKGSGMKLRWFGDPQKPTIAELEEAIGPQTACCLYFVNTELEGKQLPLKEVAEVCHRHGIPVIVDAAAQFPPFSNTWKFTRDEGADLAIFSGGKGFHGPQASGLMVGRKEMIDKVMFFCPPLHSVARVSKAAREEIVGLLAAVEVMSKRSAEEIFAEFEGRLQTIYEMVEGIPGVQLHRRFGTDVGKPFNHIRLKLDEAVAKMSTRQLVQALDEGEPRIHVGELPTGEIMLNGEMLRPGEEFVVAGRIAQILRRRA